MTFSFSLQRGAQMSAAHVASTCRKSLRWKVIQIKGFQLNSRILGPFLASRFHQVR